MACLRQEKNPNPIFTQSTDWGFDFLWVIPVAQGGWQTSIPAPRQNFSYFPLRPVIPHWQPQRGISFLQPHLSSPRDSETPASKNHAYFPCFHRTFCFILSCWPLLALHFWPLRISPFCIPAWPWCFFCFVLFLFFPLVYFHQHLSVLERNGPWQLNLSNGSESSDYAFRYQSFSHGSEFPEDKDLGLIHLLILILETMPRSEDDAINGWVNELISFLFHSKWELKTRNELSSRKWRCQESLESHPCSLEGHAKQSKELGPCMNHTLGQQVHYY